MVFWIKTINRLAMNLSPGGFLFERGSSRSQRVGGFV
jgi:hypothetical protein